MGFTNCAGAINGHPYPNTLPISRGKWVCEMKSLLFTHSARLSGTQMWIHEYKCEQHWKGSWHQTAEDIRIVLERGKRYFILQKLYGSVWCFFANSCIEEHRLPTSALAHETIPNVKDPGKLQAKLLQNGHRVHIWKAKNSLALPTHLSGRQCCKCHSYNCHPMWTPQHLWG